MIGDSVQYHCSQGRTQLDIPNDIMYNIYIIAITLPRRKPTLWDQEVPEDA
jgi:hypothetical protein